MRIFLTGMLACSWSGLKSLFCEREPRPLGRAALRLGRENLLERRGRKRLRDVVALALVVAELAQPLELGRGLDAFGDEPQAEAARQRDARGDDGGVVGVVTHPLHEHPVELERAHRNAL